MITSERRNDIISRSLASLPCAKCLHDSAFASGMAGGARCVLIDAAMRLNIMQPEWRHDGAAWTCAAFQPDVAPAEAVTDQAISPANERASS